MTSSWFFLSTLNYDARPSTHHICMKLIHSLIDFKLDHSECPESYGSSAGCSWTNVNKYSFFSTQQQLISCSQSATRPVVAVTSQSVMSSYVPSLGSWQIHSLIAALKLRFLPPSSSRCITFTLTMSCYLLACRNGRNLTMEGNPSKSDIVTCQ